jgi:hypothetical protein
MLFIAHDPIGIVRISIQKKDLFIRFELLEKIYKVSAFIIDVLLDILLPRINGYETRSKINTFREVDRSTNVLQIFRRNLL